MLVLGLEFYPYSVPKLGLPMFMRYAFPFFFPITSCIHQAEFLYAKYGFCQHFYFQVECSHMANMAKEIVESNGYSNGNAIVFI